MHVCGGGFGGVNPWFGVVFESQEEAEKVMKVLEQGIEELEQKGKEK